MLHTGCAPNTGASHSVGKTRGTMVSKFEGFWHDSARGCPVYRKNPQHHSYSPPKQHATLDPKQHSSNTTWGWRGHCWDTASKPPSLPAEQPGQPHWPSKAPQAQSGSCSTEKWLSSSSPSCLRVPPWPHGWQYSCQTSSKQWKALSQVGRGGVYTHFIFSECSVSGIACVIKLMMHFQAYPVFLGRKEYKGNCIANSWMTTKIPLSQKNLVMHTQLNRLEREISTNKTKVMSCSTDGSTTLVRPFKNPYKELAEKNPWVVLRASRGKCLPD